MTRLKHTTCVALLLSFGGGFFLGEGIGRICDGLLPPSFSVAVGGANMVMAMFVIRHLRKMIEGRP